MLRLDYWFGADLWPPFKVEGPVTGGELFIGLATVLLGLGTLWLGFEARRTGRLTRESIERQERPFAIPAAHTPATKTPGRFGFDQNALPPRQWLLTIGLWNLGRGPAIVERVSFRDGSHEVLEDVGREVVVAPGGQYDGYLDLPLGSPHIPSTGAICSVVVEYRDTSDIRYRTTSTVVMVANNECEVRDFRRRKIGGPVAPV